MDIRVVEDGKNLHLLIKGISDEDKVSLTSLLSNFVKKEISMEVNNDIQTMSSSDIDLPPFFLNEENEVSVETDELGNHVVNMGKYQGKGLTIKEIFEKDFEWMEFTSTHSKQEDAKKMKDYLAQLKNS
jgi:hypothetical protein